MFTFVDGGEYKTSITGFLFPLLPLISPEDLVTAFGVESRNVLIYSPKLKNVKAIITGVFQC